MSGVQVMVMVTLAALGCSTLAAGASSPIMARTAQGRLRGSLMHTLSGKPFLGFRGVRYAEAPVGDYRFKPPVPVKPWGEEVKDATQDGPICHQPYASEIGSPVSEDCLFLGIYSKELSSSAKQPVMVFFHPGGYAGVTGNSYWDGPEYLMDKDIVLVTINYRLGPLGFVSTGDSVLLGNYGVKDQVEALKWVQQNVAFFGGDPERVTIFGYSAGGASVMLHMLSPMSRGLFHRAIAMSGSATSAWAINRRPKALATRLANILGCPTSDSRLIYNCLMQHSAEQIVNATIPISDLGFSSIALFAPVVESGSDNDRFLVGDPYHLLLAGEFAQVPLVTGVTRDEFSYIGYYALLNSTVTDEFNQEFDKIAPREFMYEKEGQRSQHISEALRSFYLNNQPVSNRTRTDLMKIYRDSIITFSVVQAAKLIAAKSSQPVYLYLFNYTGTYSHRYLPGTNTPLGIVHHDDLIYLLYISKLFPKFNTTDRDAGMVRTLTSIWTSFAKDGVPRPPCTSTVWQPLQRDQDRFLEIKRCPQMVSGLPFPRRMAFWESKFPLVGPHQEHY